MHVRAQLLVLPTLLNAGNVVTLVVEIVGLIQQQLQAFPQRQGVTTEVVDLLLALQGILAQDVSVLEVAG